MRVAPVCRAFTNRGPVGSSLYPTWEAFLCCQQALAWESESSFLKLPGLEMTVDHITLTMTSSSNAGLVIVKLI